MMTCTLVHSSMTFRIFCAGLYNKYHLAQRMPLYILCTTKHMPSFWFSTSALSKSLKPCTGKYSSRWQFVCRPFTTNPHLYHINDQALFLWETWVAGIEKGEVGLLRSSMSIRESLNQWAARSRVRGWRWRSKCRGQRRHHPSSCRCPWSGWWPRQGYRTATRQRSAQWFEPSSPPVKRTTGCLFFQ